MTKKNIANVASSKGSAKASVKAPVKATAKKRTAKAVEPVRTGVNPEWKNIRQFDPVGKLTLEYKNVYRYSPIEFHRYRFEVQKDGSVFIFKFSRTGRKFRFIAEAKTLRIAERDCKAGKYKSIFAI